MNLSKRLIYVFIHLNSSSLLVQYSIVSMLCHVIIIITIYRRYNLAVSYLQERSSDRHALIDMLTIGAVNFLNGNSNICLSFSYQTLKSLNNLIKFIIIPLILFLIFSI